MWVSRFEKEKKNPKDLPKTKYHVTDTIDNQKNCCIYFMIKEVYNPLFGIQ